MGWERQRGEKVLKACSEATVHRTAVTDMGFMRCLRTALGFQPEHLEGWSHHHRRRERLQEHVFSEGGEGHSNYSFRKAVR